MRYTCQTLHTTTVKDMTLPVRSSMQRFTIDASYRASVLFRTWRITKLMTMECHVHKTDVALTHTFFAAQTSATLTSFSCCTRDNLSAAAKRELHLAEAAQSRNKLCAAGAGTVMEVSQSLSLCSDYLQCGVQNSRNSWKRKG